MTAHQIKSALEALGRLQNEVDWLEQSTAPVDGEDETVREAWVSVRLEMARIGAALAPRNPTT